MNEDGGGMRYRYRLLDTEPCWDGHFRLVRHRLRHELWAGGESEVLQREVFDRGAAVGVIPYDPVRDRVVVLEQFRAGAVGVVDPPWLTEFVAGLVEPGETPEAVAHRELAEEAALAASQLELVARFFMSPGGSTELMWLYCACVDAVEVEGVHGHPEEGEDIRVRALPFAAAMALRTAEPPLAGWTLLGFEWLGRERARLRREWAGIGAE
ncbi:MAG: NUDIX domain-containing protein [Ectothiorhodospiraceae bacterium]|nr:NUDIX domain-containing protein [Chromatiales bacterium]MCP5156756.1 NUDIX domain-containing protein [Ectothiorhodospiraceae bacterium]